MQTSVIFDSAPWYAVLFVPALYSRTNLAGYLCLFTYFPAIISCLDESVYKFGGLFCSSILRF